MGGKGSTTVQSEQTYDPVASAKMSEIAERQQQMAEEQWQMYKDYFQEYEIESAKANRELLAYISETSKATIGAQVPVTKEFYRQSLEGVDAKERADKAGTEVISAMRLGEGMRRREMSRYGIDPSSSTYANMANIATIETAKGVAGARTKARTQAEAENYQRLGYSLGKGMYQTRVGSDADPLSRAQASYSGAAQTYAPLASRVLSGRQTSTESATALGVAGNVGAIAAGAAGAYFGASSQDFKQDIELVGEAEVEELLQEMERIDIVKYKYLPKMGLGDKEHVGVIAEKIPAQLVTSDGKFLDIIDCLGVSFAAIKSLRRQVKELQEGQQNAKTIFRIS